MPLVKEQKLIESIENNPNLKAIRILTTYDNFEKRYEGSISQLFRGLKNGMNSFQGKSNREYFKNLSGCYFSLGEPDLFEIIILYDGTINNLNRIQVATRIKKLLGLSTVIELGVYSDYADRIKEMIGIVRKTQKFGNWY